MADDLIDPKSFVVSDVSLKDQNPANLALIRDYVGKMNGSELTTKSDIGITFDVKKVAEKILKGLI